MKITKRFNLIALWVAKSIVEPKTIRFRVKRLTTLVDIASHLLQLNNFSTLMAFIAGFNKAAVQRLKHTIKELPARTGKRLAELETLMTAESSYKNYRSKIHSVNPPCIPYIGVYLLDLTYIEDGNPNTIGKLINFAKRRLIFSLIREVRLYQDQPYLFRRVEEVIQGLEAAFILPLADRNSINSTLSTNTALRGEQALLKDFEEQMFEISLQREPRGSDRNEII